MFLRYFDKEGKEIQHSEWQDLFDDRSYVRICHYDDRQRLSIECYWVGVVGHDKDPPKPFGVCLKTFAEQTDPNGKSCRQLIREWSSFYPTEADAKAQFNKLCKEMKVKPRKPRRRKKAV